MARQKGTPKHWQEKVCPRCGVELTEDNHVPRYIRVGRYICRDCTNKHLKKYREDNKEKLKARKRKWDRENKDKRNAISRKWHKKRRKEVLDMLGGECVYCGCDVYEALEINHINGHTYKTTSGVLSDIRAGREDLTNLELTCKVCNAWHCLTVLMKIPNRWSINWE